MSAIASFDAAAFDTAAFVTARNGRATAAAAAAGSAATARNSAPLPRLRLTRRGRVVFTVLAAIPVVIAALVFALNGGGAVATSDTATVPLQTITVQSGQTLWSLAEEIAPNADPRDFIAEVLAVNGDAASMLQTGSQLAIPAKYSHP